MPATSLASRPAWWQWPTVLSLDAPAVTMAWQIALASSVGFSLHPAHVWVLATSVWLAYVADRWAEGWRLTSERVRTQRHRFYHRHRWPVALVWSLVLIADVAVSITTLPRADLVRGLVLTSAVLLYLLVELPLVRRRRWDLPKEACTALLLTAGVGLFLATSTRATELVWPLALFALLCFTNCALISAWERDVDLAHGQSSMALRSHRSAGAIRLLPFVGGAAWIVFGLLTHPSLRPVAIAGAASAAGLAAIDRLEPRLGWPPARVLADAVLLSPVAALIWQRWSA